MELPTPLRTTYIPLLYLTNILALGFKPSVLRTLTTLPLTLLFLSQAVYNPRTHLADDYPMNVLACAAVFTWVDWIALGSPDREGWTKLRYAEGDGEMGEVEKKVPQGFWVRVWWGVRLATTNRYVGWSQQVKNVPVDVGAQYPRCRRFVLRKALRAAFFYVLKDATNSYTASTPHGGYQERDGPEDVVGFDGLPFSRKAFLSCFHIVLCYVSLEFAMAMYGAVSVALGFANPRDCPSAFGDLKEAYTVRNCWSVVWHQQMRRICSTPSIWLARDVLQLRKGSFASKYLQLFMGFFISGLCHAGASMLCYKSWKEDDASIACFMSQALVILVEDHIIKFAGSMGLKKSRFWRYFGYCWTTLWFGISTCSFTSSITGNGLWIHPVQYDLFGIGPGA
ncbi:hypothetical protein BS50DRAFT_557722 [Corynespora cassiicola Philippines]|uniref:Wax synthase domain-containing protein n=1 Tax=Corynespora cassiicola Philippines TaxID=1448308 RepID=A0A2T2NDW8_CORCC|nr:hypothetical protein BS50DRAFT_557722 [Corynespora cassiicola Philippines]